MLIAVGLVLAGAAAPTAAAPRPVSATEAPVPYTLPVRGAVLRLFDPPEVRWAAGHRGVDLAAEPGAVVRAPATGVVAFAGVVAGRGVVTVRHPDGLRSSLEPVTASVAAGDQVASGDPLGELESRATHPGLHWGVRRGEVYLDPLGLLPSAGPVVLLPDR